MSIILQVLTGCIAVVFSLFLYWKELRNDYTQNHIFISGFTLLGTTLAGALIATWIAYYIPTSPVFSSAGLWFWGGIVGFFVGFLINKIRFKFRTFESFEAASMSTFIFALFFVRQWGVLIFAVALFIIFLFLKNNYRKFTWYRSGKIGFAAVLTLGVMFLVRAVVSILPVASAIPMFFIGKVDTILSLLFAVTLFFAFYNLAQSK